MAQFGFHAFGLGDGAGSPTSATVLITCTHPIVADGLGMFLTAEPDFSVVGHCLHATDLADAVARQKPDLILLDTELPGLVVLPFLNEMSRFHGRARVLVYSDLPGDRNALACIRAGAMGFMRKPSDPVQLLVALRCLLEDHLWIHREHLGNLGDF
jgi:two-component system, NarL family, invasion response regulator UvrY